MNLSVHVYDPGPEKLEKTTNVSRRMGVSCHGIQVGTSGTCKVPLTCSNPPGKPSVLSLDLDRPYPHNHIEGLSPPLKYSSLPEGGALPLPDRHVVHSFGEGGISAAHGHSCGYKEQQPERHDHEALPGQEQVPTDPHPRQPQLPRTPAAVRHTPPGRAQEVGGVEERALGPSSELAAT